MILYVYFLYQMNKQNTTERFLEQNEIIVSKTDTKGIITYANQVFCEIADYSLGEVLGKPHNILRNPDMPACIFKLFWETIKSGNELFSYVVNSGKNGVYYWVFAHVTPSFNEAGTITGFHSNRRKPSESALKAIKELYANLLRAENACSTRQDGIETGYKMLMNLLKEKEMTYEEFVLSL